MARSRKRTIEVVFWDFDPGEVSSFATTVLNVQGITPIGSDVLIAGSFGSSYNATTLSRYTCDGRLVETLNGPSGIHSATAHAPEPGTALLMGLGLPELRWINRRRAREHSR